MSGSAALDAQSLREIDALEAFQRGARAEVVRLFFESLARDRARIAEAAARGDRVALRSAAHSIKGCALGVGARRLAEVAATIEVAARAERDDGSTLSTGALDVACDAACAALRDWLAEARTAD